MDNPWIFQRPIFVVFQVMGPKFHASHPPPFLGRIKNVFKEVNKKEPRCPMGVEVSQPSLLLRDEKVLSGSIIEHEIISRAQWKIYQRACRTSAYGPDHSLHNIFDESNVMETSFESQSYPIPFYRLQKEPPWLCKKPTASASDFSNIFRGVARLWDYLLELIDVSIHRCPLTDIRYR